MTKYNTTEEALSGAISELASQRLKTRLYKQHLILTFIVMLFIWVFALLFMWKYTDTCKEAVQYKADIRLEMCEDFYNDEGE